MKSLIHYATCPVWSTGSGDDCTCVMVPAWVIRKEPGERFPWRIWRRTSDYSYVPMMRASTWPAAMQLVEQLVWLRNNAVTREPHD